MTTQQKSYLFITSMITDWIGQQEVLLPINHKNYSFQEKKNFQDRGWIVWFKLQFGMWLVQFKLQLSNNNLTSELVENRGSLNSQSQSRKLFSDHNDYNCVGICL